MPAIRSLPGLDPTGVGYDAVGVVDLVWVSEVPDVPESAFEDPAERLVRRFLTLCEHPRSRDRMLGLVKTSVRGGRTGRRIYALLNRTVLHPLLWPGGIKASALKYELVASQLVGLGMMRYVLGLEPVASMSIDELVPHAAVPIRAILAAD